MKSKEKVKVLKVPLLGELIMSRSRTIIGVVLGLIAGGILIALTGVNSFDAYASMLRGCFSSPQSFSNVLVRMSPLLLGGMGVALGIQAGVWNTGIEGYMYLGAIGAAVAGIPDLHLPIFLHIILVMAVAMLFAAAWGAIPGFLRAYMGVNEVTSTIMMNYIAIYFTTWVVTSVPAIAESGAFYPMSKIFQTSAQLPILMSGTSLHPGPLIGLAVCILFHFILKYTPFGFRTRMLGGNIHAAKYSGVDTKKQILMILILGAMIGGLSGAIEVSGLKRRVYMEFVTGVGYESVAVALLAGGNPIGVIASAFFFACLKVGGATMSIETGVSSSMNSIIIALCVLFVIGAGFKDGSKLKKEKKVIIAKAGMSLEQKEGE